MGSYSAGNNSQDAVKLRDRDWQFKVFLLGAEVGLEALRGVTGLDLVSEAIKWHALKV